MKRHTLSLVLTSLLLAHTAIAVETTATDDYRNAIKQLRTALKTALQQALQANGAIAALAVCQERALPLTAQLSQQLGITLGRTSLRLRNPKNAPNEWQIKILKQFEQRKAQGEDISKLEYHEVVTTPKGQREVHYMKAVAMEEGCLMCHGDDIAPELRAKLAELYPQDQAVGFKVGDIRGAATVIKILP
jgi:hypothetical protein